MSLAYSFESGSVPTQRRTQYYEMLGDRAIWHEGWKAVTRHRRGIPFDDDDWALYHTDVDFSECDDLAAAQPDKLAEMVETWWAEAAKYNVLPLDDRRGGELMLIRRPGHGPPGNVHRFLAGVPHLERHRTPDTRNRSFQIRARVAHDDGAAGVLVAFGARTGGYSFFVDADGRLCFTNNRLGVMHDVWASDPLPAGDLDLLVRFDKTAEHEGAATVGYDAGDGIVEMASGPVVLLPYRQTTYGMSIGRDNGPTITPAYDGAFPYSGRLHWVEWELQDDRDDLIEAADQELENQLADQ